MSEQAQRIQEIKARADAAYPGEWRGTDGYSDQVLSIGNDGLVDRHICDIRGWGHLTGRGSGALHMTDEAAGKQMQNDAEFIAHARQDIPWLIEQLEAALKKQQPMLVLPVPTRDGKYFKCPACQSELKDIGGTWEIGFESEQPEWCPDCGQHLSYPAE